MIVEWVTPEAYILASTSLDDGVIRFLNDLGAEQWVKATAGGFQEGERLIEIAGRTCYKSFGVGLNPNITKVRTESKDYFENVLRKGDGSIFEHATVTFGFLNVSRVFTHELVRHRVGTAISQESMRYSRPTELRMVRVPGSELSRAIDDFRFIERGLEETWARYEHNVRVFMSDTMSFDQKKAWTSALRRMLPDGIATSMVWTANHRTLRHVIEMRTNPAAEVEIRFVFDKVAEMLKDRFPLIYGDFEAKSCADGVGKTWTPKLRSKV